MGGKGVGGQGEGYQGKDKEKISLISILWFRLFHLVLIPNNKKKNSPMVVKVCRARKSIFLPYGWLNVGFVSTDLCLRANPILISRSVETSVAFVQLRRHGPRSPEKLT